ncbi:MAG TPA: serine/threonine-protein kinase [Candidatus Paceibacterota bacterium]|nr:serine/threonine-protein kinase [Verrucomicrobiota bacterium]HRY51622.1 serine/threonine-protein kinase [Candidatus Paceibacterota bacterium]
MFATTHWSVVLAAVGSDTHGAHVALERLCRTYWYPLYAYVRRRGHSAHDAQKRGGGQMFFSLDWATAEERFDLEPATQASPDRLFEKQWALALLAEVMDRLEQEYCRDGKEDLFAALKQTLQGSRESQPYAEMAMRLGMNEGAIKGAVYTARQKELDRIVALKILPPDIGEDPAFADRFAREAKALAKLNHSGIVTIHDFGRADGLFYFLMEYVDGVNLRQLLQAGRISAREALAIVPQICDALQYAHDQGIVHRDIKPENVLLDRFGRVKVADFGLAKIVEGGAVSPLSSVSSPAEVELQGVAYPANELTETGKIMGTPQYMAPEQKEHPSEVDHRVDIYALGVVLYQMLTGELPGQKIEPPSKKIQVDVRLDEVVLRALEKKPELRYQQASVLKTQIETISSTASPSGTLDEATEPTGHSGAIWTSLAGAIKRRSTSGTPARTRKS